VSGSVEAHMIQLRHVLCPIDFSEPSRRALEHALTLARWYGARLTALHVVPATLPPLSSLGVSTSQSLEPHVRERLRTDLLEELRRFSPAEAKKIEMDGVVREGDTATEIARETRAADLVVLGSHGRSGVERGLLGSVTEKVLRKAACPVLTVPHRAQESGRTPQGPVFKRILCAVDFSEASLHALEYALSFAQEADGRVRLLHVVDGSPGEESAGSDRLTVGEYRRSREAEARERLETLVPQGATQWSDAEPMVVAGTPYREILRLAEEGGTDLVAMGVHAKRGLGALFFGSTANHVVRAASCPVLTARSAAKD
jgi:nucleotide-binding universal stress UspA family protein